MKKVLMLVGSFVFLVASSVNAASNTDGCQNCLPGSGGLAADSTVTGIVIPQIPLLSNEQAENANRKICSRMETYTLGGKIKKSRMRNCRKPERAKFCASLPEVMEPKDFIPLMISETLEITTHQELDKILPGALTQLMTMPCDKNRTEDYEQNNGDNFIKRAISHSKVHTVLSDFIVPLCKKQDSYHGCIEQMIIKTTETLGDGTEESLVDYAKKLKRWEIKYNGITLLQNDVNKIYVNFASLENEVIELHNARIIEAHKSHN